MTVERFGLELMHLDISSPRFSRFTRWILDYFMHTRVMYHALHQSGRSKQYIIQDVVVPYSAATELLEYVDESFGHFPL